MGSFGIIGPHAGYEADLLLKGTKPIGLFCTIKNLPVKALAQERTEQDIVMLDLAVSQSRLSKLVVEMPPQPFWSGRSGIAHFYCQKG